MKLFLCILLMLGAAFAQSNVCTYRYTFGTGPSFFSFCLTPYGTLASLQGSTGELLDASNPVEGFAICDLSEYAYFRPFLIFPGAGVLSDPAPTVSQPKGAGKLPIVFSYSGMDINTTVSAVIPTKTVVFTTPFQRIGSQGEYAFGPWTRLAALDNANFSVSTTNAYGYSQAGGLISLQGRYNASSGAPGVYGTLTPECMDGTLITPFTGSGELFNTVGYSSTGRSVFSYRVF